MQHLPLQTRTHTIRILQLKLPFVCSSSFKGLTTPEGRVRLGKRAAGFAPGPVGLTCFLTGLDGQQDPDWILARVCTGWVAQASLPPSKGENDGCLSADPTCKGTSQALQPWQRSSRIQPYSFPWTSSHPVSPSFVLSSQMQSIPPESVGLGKLRGAPCQTRGRHGSQAPLPTRSVLLRLCSERVSLGKVPPHLLSLEISPCLAF